jgi:hypothetical protein
MITCMPPGDVHPQEVAAVCLRDPPPGQFAVELLGLGEVAYREGG